MTPILAAPTATQGQAGAWAKKHGATGEFVGLAKLYWQLAPPRGGVDPAVGYAQSFHETGGGRFGGVLDATYHNPCGLKTTGGGGNEERTAHTRFPSWREGVTAHLDHLALYAGAPGYPRQGSPDPRHFPSLKGTAKTVEALGGKWAPSPTYGQRVAQLARDIGGTPMVKTVHEPRTDVDCRGLVQDHGPHTPVRVVLHDTESYDRVGVSDIRGIAEFFQRQGLGYGSHLVIDLEGKTGRLVDDDRIGWHVGGANTGSLGIEQIGFGRFRRADWAKRPAQLEKVARWLAWWSKRWGIPLTLATGRGVCTHAMMSALHPESGGHTDPGFGYPLADVIARARVLKKTGW